ncbi:MAG: hypothetical protein IRY90_03460 [Actinomadura rubrobrunea]|nr:hypothetical protein [Actinomadura rubrobrunea]
MLKSAPDAGEVTTSLFVAVFNVSIALGALSGGVTADGIATTGVLRVAAALTLLAAATVGGHRKTL